jgi:RHS repeat-associated protein
VHDITGGAPGTLLEEYAYDGNGNRQKALSTYPGAVPLDTEFPTSIRCPGPSGDTAANTEDQLCEYGGFTYVYNARGQLESKTDGAATTTYTCDGLGRLEQVTDRDGADQVVMDIHYVHDALGRRIGRVRDGNLEKGWLYADALNPIAELDSAGNVRATFLYGTRAHVPDAMVMADGTVYRFITDHLGSVRLVVDAETGEVVQRMDYDAFGRVLQDTTPGFQPFGFAGGLYDDDTGLVRFGARDYDAYSGRWTAKDASLFQAGDANLYAYSYLDPVNFIDVDGNHPLFWIVLALIFVESDAQFSAGNLLDIVPLPCPKGVSRVVGRAGSKAAGHGFRSFSAFKRAMGRAGDGRNWHHIVEQTPANVRRFGPETIHNTQNLINLDSAVHREVSAYYSRIQPFTGGQTVRQWLSTQSLDAQHQFGTQVLRDFGAVP